MKKRMFHDLDGNVFYATIAERIGCLIGLLIVIGIWIFGLIALIRKIF